MTTKHISISIPTYVYTQYLSNPDIDNLSQFIIQYFLKGIELTESDAETTKKRNIDLINEVSKLKAEITRLKRVNYLLVAKYRTNNQMTPTERMAEGILRRGIG